MESLKFNLKIIFIPLKLKFFFKISIAVFKFLVFFLAVSFLITKIILLKIIGFWIILILALNYLILNKKPLKDLRFEKSSNLADFLDRQTKFFIFDAVKDTELLKNPGKLSLIILHKLLNISEIKSLIYRLNVDLKSLKNEIKYFLSLKEEINLLDIPDKSINLIAKNLEPILLKAYEISKEYNFSKINFSALLLAIVESKNPIVEEILNKNNILSENLRPAIALEHYKKILFVQEKHQPLAVFLRASKRKRWLNRSWTSMPTPLLDQMGEDLTYLAEIGEIGLIVGHKKEIERINYLIEKEHKINFLIAGREGSGREVIVWYLALLLAKDQVPEKYFDYRLIKINIPEIYAYNPNEFLTNIQLILNEAVKSRNVILYIPELQNILLSELLASCWPLFSRYLINLNLPLIATITSEGYAKTEANFNLNYLFEVIEVEELNIDEATILISLEAILWEKSYKITLHPQAISKGVILAQKFLKHKPLPGSARDLLLETIGFAKNLKEKIVTAEMVGDVFTKITGIPIKAPLESEKYILQNLEKIIHQRLVNQEYAVKEVARTLRIYRAGLKKSGPIAVFLFVGPTGVGKTELAKTLAKIYFGGEDQMLRLDMVEFQKPEDIEKLIGNEEKKIAGILSETILKKPYLLILLDEFEKAHPDILNLFLPIFDEGYIKDGYDRTIDFSNSLIICTSNALSDFIKEKIKEGQDIEKLSPIIRDKLSEIFPIELLNRFSQVIVFRTLTKEDLRQIVDLLIKDFNGLLLQKFSIFVELTTSAKERIIDLGYNELYGARELKRTIEQEVIGPLSDFLLREELTKGNKVLVDFQENFTFKII